MAEKPKLPLGSLLIQKGIISEDQLRITLIEQDRTGQPLGKLLITLGFVTEATVREALSENLDQQSTDLSNMVVDAAALKMIPKDIATRYKAFPVVFDKTQGTLVLAMSDTSNIVALDQINAMLGGDVNLTPMLASESDISKAIDQFYGFELSIDGILHEIETGEINYQSLKSVSDEYSQPLVRLMDAILADAVQQNASDIHFEPEQFFLRIRYRIDGILRQIRSLHKTYWPAMVVRLKVMSNMNIAETRAPQDGRISIRFSGRQIDFRASAQPTTHGENVVLRILDRQKGVVPLEELGLDDNDLTVLKLMLARPEGIILVTGPTGSGKTTTLYSILNHINTESVNIMTLEDPVEYPMMMIRQTSVNESAKMGFASGIRSMMRQDPDIILVGEIRDAETADMAFSAAMTGHQVYSTLHTNSAIGAIPRLQDIGILPDKLAGNIIGIVAQRLIRRLCPHCKKGAPADQMERRLLGIPASDPDVIIYHPVGCERCTHKGYKGRLAIMELLKMNSELDDLIARHVTAREIRTVAMANGFRPIVEDGIRRVRDGSSSLDEISRVVDLTIACFDSRFNDNAMVMYLYQSMDAAGKTVRGNMDANNLPDLEMRLKRMELDLIDCKLQASKSFTFGRGKVMRADLINFCFHMEQMTGAGVPLLEGMGDLRDSTDNPRFREVVADLIENIEGGAQLSEAMARYPSVFDRTFTSLITAGEQSGKLSEVFKNLSESLKWQDELAAQTKKILMYPAFVGTIVVGVTFFLMIYLVPQLVGFIKNMGGDLPLHTRVLIFVSDLFVNYWYAILALPMVSFIGLKILLKNSPQARYKADDYKLRIWFIGPILHKIILSRFATFFALMYAAGITILDGIRLSEEIVSNEVVSGGLKRAGQLISEGQTVTAAFEATGIFPPLVIRMLKIGESTGQLDAALRNVSYFYNRDIKEKIERVQALIEPVMTVILGLLLAWVMLSVLGPIYDLISKMKT